MSDKPRLAISFSGGRTSAVMTKLCIENYAETHEISIQFANTGCEAEETLRFVDAVDRHWCQPAGLPVTWIEAEVHGPRKGVTAKVVDYETASRNGEPFEAAIKKHGVFCKTHPQCTSRLKEEPMGHYREKQLGWKKGTYLTAIGIRADEIDRMSSKAKEKGFIYPLVNLGWTKDSIKEFMAQFEWDLNLPGDHYGNCVWCWKKSFRKLMTLAKDDPSIFDFPKEMERKYGHIDRSRDQSQKEDRVFFRGRTSTVDLLFRSMQEEFEPYSDEIPRTGANFDEMMDLGSGCGDSCEIGADE